MKIQYKIISLSIFFGLFFWIIDTMVDYPPAYKSTFLKFLFDVPYSKLYIRSVVFICFLTYGILMSKTIIRRKEAEEKINIYQKQLQSLASQLSLAEERERHRIAINLHDNISQILASIKIKLGEIMEMKFPVPITNSLKEIYVLTEQTIKYSRTLTSELSPPILYELGFESAVEWLTEETEKRHNIPCRFEDDKQHKPIDNDIRVILFLTVRELLINVVKHAKANKIKISLQKKGNNIQIIVKDDGIGFNLSKIESTLSQKGSFGLFSIRERLNPLGGKLIIKSRFKQGTTAIITAPLKTVNGES